MTDKEKLVIERILNGEDVIRFGYFDKAGRWWPDDDLNFMQSYCKSYREPSRKWQYSYLRAVSTKKFLTYVKNLSLEAL
ncbi:MAG: hypothetical protein QXV17_07630 [Candidatus Micrarchaeaceae archaeon]